MGIGLFLTSRDLGRALLRDQRQLMGPL